MPPAHVFLGLKLEEWAALATIANVLTVVVLIVVNILYLKAANKQASAAATQAAQSQLQATAAQANINFLKARLEEEVGVGRNMVLSAIDGAINSIGYWHSRPLTDLSRASSLPDPGDIVPRDASSILDHARRISPNVGRLVSEGFDNLGLVKHEIERLRNANVALPRGFYDASPSKAPEYLAMALDKFKQARSQIVG
jgi:hypothetical protein